jgi:hypothetical protein
METPTHIWIDAEEAEDARSHPLRDGAEKITHLTESMASKTPTLLFLFAALAAVAISAALQLGRKRHLSLFIGQWAPSLLLFGLYNKLSKTMGAD